MRKIIKTSRDRSPAGQFLLYLLSQCDVSLLNNTIPYYSYKTNMIFKIEKSNGMLWYNYHIVYVALANEFKLGHNQINQLVHKVICKELDCKELKVSYLVTKVRL